MGNFFRGYGFLFIVPWISYYKNIKEDFKLRSDKKTEILVKMYFTSFYLILIGIISYFFYRFLNVPSFTSIILSTHVVCCLNGIISFLICENETELSLQSEDDTKALKIGVLLCGIFLGFLIV